MTGVHRTLELCIVCSQEKKSSPSLYKPTDFLVAKYLLTNLLSFLWICLLPAQDWIASRLPKTSPFLKQGYPKILWLVNVYHHLSVSGHAVRLNLPILGQNSQMITLW